MKDLIKINRGIEFCHEMKTMSSKHSVGDGICASPTFLTNYENKKKVLTALFPIRGAGEFPLNSPCRNVFLSTRKMWRGIRMMWSWFFERTFSLHRTLLEGRGPKKIL
jgi:hypothetical protein